MAGSLENRGKLRELIDKFKFVCLYDQKHVGGLDAEPRLIPKHNAIIAQVDGAEIENKIQNLIQILQQKMAILHDLILSHMRKTFSSIYFSGVRASGQPRAVGFPVLILTYFSRKCNALPQKSRKYYPFSNFRRLRKQDTTAEAKPLSIYPVAPAAGEKRPDILRHLLQQAHSRLIAAPRHVRSQTDVWQPENLLIRMNGGQRLGRDAITEGIGRFSEWLAEL